MHPFLRWTGGKRWLIKKQNSFLPQKIEGTYIEPFLGGGSVFFHLLPQKALLGDQNKDLIITYQSVKENYKSIVDILTVHHEKHSKEYYYQVRDLNPTSNIEKAARFIYLNRTCFNGIYRVNSKGKFNVPIGTKMNVLLSDDIWDQWANALGKSQLISCDFEELINKARKDDFLFIDPPYTVRHNNNGFIQYNEVLFSWQDQERLAQSVNKARKRGAQIIVTNANHLSIHELYNNEDFNLTPVSRYSSISSKITERNNYEELIITANLKENIQCKIF